MNEVSFLLPHSEDMVLIDEVICYTNTSIDCRSIIKYDERFINDNKFYTYRTLEIMAQSLGILSSLLNNDKKASIGFLLGSRVFNIYKNYLNVGDEIIVKSQVSSCDEFGFGVYESNIYLKDELCASARLSLLSPNKSQLEEMMNG